ncbi:MAG: helix-turn-helix domain-containing protein [bacterium]
MCDQVKETILEVALKLFQRFGYKKTTIEEIAREAGIGKGTVYLHFTSKEEILLTLIHNLHQTTIEEWIRIVHKSWTPEKKVSTMLKSCIAEIQRKREEVSLATLPPRLIHSVLKMSESTREQRLTLLATVLEPLYRGDDRLRNTMARVLLDSANNIIFRLDVDKHFPWEEYLDDSLELLLEKSDKTNNLS